MWKRDKFLVEIIGENGIKSRKKYRIENNRVMIDPPKKRGRGHSGWMPEFNRNCILYYHAWFLFFRRLKCKLMVMEGASKCIEFKGKDVEVPVYDMEASKKHITANVIKSAGETTQKITIPVFVYVLLGILFVLALLNLLVSSGRFYV